MNSDALIGCYQHWRSCIPRRIPRLKIDLENPGLPILRLVINAFVFLRHNDVIPRNRTDDVALQHWSQLFELDKMILTFSQFPMAFLHGFIFFFKYVKILWWIIFDIVFVQCWIISVVNIRKKKKTELLKKHANLVILQFTVNHIWNYRIKQLWTFKSVYMMWYWLTMEILTEAPSAPPRSIFP